MADTESDCRNCRHWRTDTVEERGECRRYPPVRPDPEPGEVGPVLWEWPMTFRDDYCGEFQPRL